MNVQFQDKTNAFEAKATAKHPELLAVTYAILNIFWYKIHHIWMFGFELLWGRYLQNRFFHGSSELSMSHHSFRVFGHRRVRLVLFKT
jgi:hypothetical protein